MIRCTTKKTLRVALWIALVIASAAAVDRIYYCCMWWRYNSGRDISTPAAYRTAQYPVVVVWSEDWIPWKVECDYAEFSHIDRPSSPQTGASYLIPFSRIATFKQLLARQNRECVTRQCGMVGHIEFVQQRKDGTQYIHMTAEAGDEFTSSWYVASADSVHFVYVSRFKPSLVEADGVLVTFAAGTLIAVVLLIRSTHNRRRVLDAAGTPPTGK